MAKDKFIIWSNEDLNLGSWQEIFDEENITSEEEQWALVYDMNNIYLDDERTTLSVIKQDILAIADLGRWNGRVSGYRDFSSVSECLTSDCDYVTWYINPEGDFCCSASHHDGTNTYIYRAWDNRISEETRQKVREAIYFNSANKDELIEKHTKPLGLEIAKIYGFKRVNDMFVA